MITLKELARVLRARDDQTRVLGGNQIISIAGSVGRIDRSLQVHLRLAALSEPARAAAQELVDSACIEPDAAGAIFLARMPVAYEITLMRECLGLNSARLSA